MGFSAVAAYTLIFVGLIILFSGAVINYHSSISIQSEAMRAEAELEYGATHARLNITASGGLKGSYVFVAVKNEGSVSLHYLDLYISNEYIARNDSNRTDSALVELGASAVFDPGETWNITYYYPVQPGNISLKIVSEYGASDAGWTLIGNIPADETITSISGTWSPALPGSALTADELFAVNNDGDAALLLNVSPTDDAGLVMDDPAHSPLNITQVHILADYTAPDLTGSAFLIEARNSSFDGQLFCSQAFANATSETTVTIDCDAAHNFSPDDLLNLYINVINNDASSVISLDWLRVELKYEY